MGSRPRRVTRARAAIFLLTFALTACGNDGGGGTVGPASSERGRVLLAEGSANAGAEASALSDRQIQSNFEEFPPHETVSMSFSVNAAEDPATASAGATLDVAFDELGGELRGVTFSATASTAATTSNEDVRGCGVGNAGASIVFEVVDRSVGYAASASIEDGSFPGDVTVRIREDDGDGGWKFPHTYVSTSSFSTTGVLAPGRYLLQFWCQTSACSADVTADTASLSGTFTITDVP